MRKRIAILGSTGSIGRQTLDIVRSMPDRFEVVALAAGRNRRLLATQMEEFRPAVACLTGPASDEGPVPTGVELIRGEPNLVSIAREPSIDLVLIATSGKAGLLPTLAAIHARKEVALANKEVLVMAGEIIMQEARRCGVAIRPVDSEHSALWQCLRGEDGVAAGQVDSGASNGHGNAVQRLILTASGGPFRALSYEELEKVTPERALAHPTWRMGRKVTIDSASLMNKGLEIIEARWLFDVPFDRIEVLLHAESIVHSMVEFVDGSIKAQLSLPDMRFPILYALSYPERLVNQFPRLELASVGTLHFSRPDFQRFPALRLALEAGREGGTLPAVLSAADDVAVELFLAGRIGFADIWRLVEAVMRKHDVVHPLTLEAVAAADEWARQTCSRLARGGG